MMSRMNRLGGAAETVIPVLQRLIQRWAMAEARSENESGRGAKSLSMRGKYACFVSSAVMPGFSPGIHEFLSLGGVQVVDARHKAGHDAERAVRNA